VDDGGGALLFTLILDRNSVNVSFPLTQLLALALCRRLERGFNLAPQIKWPNDVYVSGGKIAGILVETESDYFLCGVGVNLFQRDFPPDLRHPAISLAQAVPGNRESTYIFLPGDELIFLLSEIEAVIDEKPGIDEVEKRLAGINSPVTLKLGDPSRQEYLRGSIMGLQSDGALLVKAETGENRAVYSGEIEFLSPRRK
jgi:BirA family biotin operon repressor/biotin-[acetyl-CoA-carboxylase] ligase